MVPLEGMRLLDGLAQPDLFCDHLNASWMQLWQCSLIDET
jgi:hypothetical protein